MTDEYERRNSETDGNCNRVSGGEGDREGAVCGGDRRDGDAATKFLDLIRMVTIEANDILHDVINDTNENLLRSVFSTTLLFVEQLCLYNGNGPVMRFDETCMYLNGILYQNEIS